MARSKYLSSESIYLLTRRFKLKPLYVFAIGIIHISWFAHFPTGIFTSAKYDDQLGWSHAISILSNQWLGTYDNLTLAKGPGFSIFVALNYLSGLPISISIALFIFASGLVLRQCLSKLRYPVYIVEPIFIWIIFDPNLLPSRVFRDYITAPLVVKTTKL